MNKRFILIDQGELEYYLGVEVLKLDENTLLLHQTGYAKKVLERFKMTDCKQTSENFFVSRFKYQLDGLPW
jgi:hypothetical protein